MYGCAMADPSRVKAAKDALEAGRAAAQRLVDGVGAQQADDLLRRSAAELKARLAKIAPSLGEDSFTVVQLRAALAQVQHVLTTVTLPALRDTVVDLGEHAARESTESSYRYLLKADRAFRGAGEQPISINTTSMMDAGMQGSRASVLRRLATGVEKRRHPRTKRPTRARVGILSRYGIETIGHFERELQIGLLARKSWIDMRSDITRHSPFLQGSPKFWAHRIVRTEIMGAHNAAAHHSIVAAGQQLGGMLKILSAVFDDRTGADSYADHGQVRRPDEEFESWYGSFLHPPDRPNDRGTVVPHRQRWELPEYLEPRSDDEVAERWAFEKRKGEPPERPLMSTVEGFGDVD